MRVIVTLKISGDAKEYRLEGDAKIFDKRRKPWLGDIGFFLENWRYAGHSGPANEGWVFIPWASAPMIEEAK